VRKEVEQRQTVSTPMINKETTPLSAADVFAASQPNFQPAVLPVIAAALSHHALTAGSLHRSRSWQSWQEGQMTSRSTRVRQGSCRGEWKEGWWRSGGVMAVRGEGLARTSVCE
jgi:hypothetical protein